jgi:tetratricopeptide (TPR) repeat protein
MNLEGRVRTENGRTLPHVAWVRLETSEGMNVASQPTGPDGDFHFDSVRKIPYRLVVTAKGFQTVQKDVDLSERAGTAFVDVYMTAQTVARAQPPLARTDDMAPKEARKHFKKGIEALQARNLRKARTELEAAVKEFPCYARAQTSLALVLSSQKLGVPAEAALHKAISCDADFLDAYALLGQLLTAEKRFAESQKVLSEGIRRSPNAWQFHYHLAAALAGQEKYRLAEQEYRQTELLNTSPPKEFHARFADLYLKEHAYEKAYSQMQEYLEADPDGRFATRIRQIMREMKAAGVAASAATRQQPPH